MSIRPTLRAAKVALAALAGVAFAAGLSSQDASPPDGPAPTWESLSKRTPPAWFAEAKFGIFIHWGVYSVPAFCDTSTYSEWYQRWLDTKSHGGLVKRFHDRVYGEDFEYREFAPQFRAELFDAEQWAKVFERAGARYIVITSKHHDGFCLWPSKVASEVRGYPWNAMEVGPKRDLLGELATAVKQRGIKFGLYYSFMEWHNPIYGKSISDYVERVMFPQIKDLITRYQPSVFWPDGEWNHPDATWRSPQILRWLYDNVKNPDEFVVNDRWGKGLRGRTGDFYTTEYGDGGGGGDSYSGKRVFEECRGIGHSFAFNRIEDYDIYLSRTAAVRTLIDMVSRGGNLLLDIGPAADGTIPLIMVDRLYAIGDWLKINGEAIHGTTKSPFRATPWGRATQKGNTVYLHVYDWPQSGRLVVPLQNDVVAARVLGGDSVSAARTSTGIAIDLSSATAGKHATVVALELDALPVEDTRFLPDADGVITLPVTAATLAGDKLRLESRVDRKASMTIRNVGCWNQPGASVSWSNVRVDTEMAPMQIELELAVAPGSEGGTLEWRMGRRTGTYEIPTHTGGWQKYRRVAVGSYMDHMGFAEFRLTSKTVKGQGLCNLRAVRLVPERTGKVVAAAINETRFGAVNTRLQAMATALEEGRHADVAAFYFDHAQLAGPGGDVTTGRAAIDAYWARFGKADSWDLEVQTTEGSGNLVVQRGRSTLVWRPQGRRRSSVVEFVLTWALSDAGKWRILSDVYWSPK
ncbi:MAG: alpha-L-fucosidase [bacterium]|nr:alpha-L-fucosidase [bacterium]